MILLNLLKFEIYVSFDVSNDEVISDNEGILIDSDLMEVVFELLIDLFRFSKEITDFFMIIDELFINF